MSERVPVRWHRAEAAIPPSGHGKLVIHDGPPEAGKPCRVVDIEMRDGKIIVQGQAEDATITSVDYAE